MRLKNISSLFLCAVLTAFVLPACGEAPSDQAPNVEETKVENPADKGGGRVTDGRIVVSSLAKVSEPHACILPITITNGTDVETTVSMMQFSITGSGKDDSGNMFAQTVAPGDTNTARLIFPTRSCEELSVITAPNLTCKNGERDCSGDVEFEAIDGLIIQRG